MAPRILTIPAGTAVQILDGLPPDEGDLWERIRAARDRAYADKTGVVVLGGDRASPDAGVVIATVGGQLKVVKNRYGPTDN